MNFLVVTDFKDAHDHQLVMVYTEAQHLRDFIGPDADWPEPTGTISRDDLSESDLKAIEQYGSFWRDKPIFDSEYREKVIKRPA